MNRVLAGSPLLLFAAGVVLGGTTSSSVQTSVVCEFRNTSTCHPEVVLIVSNSGQDSLLSSGVGLELLEPGSLSYSYTAKLPDLSVGRLASAEVRAPLRELRFFDYRGKAASTAAVVGMLTRGDLEVRGWVCDRRVLKADPMRSTCQVHSRRVRMKPLL